MRISDWSSDVCSSDLLAPLIAPPVSCATQMPLASARSIDSSTGAPIGPNLGSTATVAPPDPVPVARQYPASAHSHITRVCTGPSAYPAATADAAPGHPNAPPPHTPHAPPPPTSQH